MAAVRTGHSAPVTGEGPETVSKPEWLGKVIERRSADGIGGRDVGNSIKRNKKPAIVAEEEEGKRSMGCNSGGGEGEARERKKQAGPAERKCILSAHENARAKSRCPDAGVPRQKPNPPVTRREV
jgi:hypothetical protein